MTDAEIAVLDAARKWADDKEALSRRSARASRGSPEAAASATDRGTIRQGVGARWRLLRDE
jgi:hypothetical protein